MAKKYITPVGREDLQKASLLGHILCLICKASVVQVCMDVVSSRLLLVVFFNRNSYQAEPLTKWVTERTGVPVSLGTYIYVCISVSVLCPTLHVRVTFGVLLHTYVRTYVL